MLSYCVKAVERLKAECWSCEAPRKACVYAHVCVKIWFFFKGRVQEKWEGSARPSNFLQEYCTCDWPLVLGHGLLSSSYISYMSQKLAYTQRGCMQQEDALQTKWEQISPPHRDPWSYYLGPNPKVHLSGLPVMGSSQSRAFWAKIQSLAGVKKAHPCIKITMVSGK